MTTSAGAIALVLLMLQLPATMVLLSRLVKGPTRRPPLQPRAATPAQSGSVSVVVPTLNEAQRITPCLEGLKHQTGEVREIIVVDSRSTDGTPELVRAAQTQDPRFSFSATIRYRLTGWVVHGRFTTAIPTALPRANGFWVLMRIPSHSLDWWPLCSQQLRQTATTWFPYPPGLFYRRPVRFGCSQHY